MAVRLGDLGECGREAAREKRKNVLCELVKVLCRRGRNTARNGAVQTQEGDQVKLVLLDFNSEGGLFAEFSQGVDVLILGEISKSSTNPSKRDRARNIT